mmetsp:Transcript_94292/g.130983  ORF Transcript_94292/g.130983 Transcript_94292/m.130983 type:complete len:445 (-) Transcript_94292:1469-2803(-)
MFPVIEEGLAHCLSGCVRSEIRLEAERLHGGQVCVHRVHWATWLRQVSNDVTAPSGEDVVNGSYAVGRALDVREHHRLHETRSRQQEGRVGHPPGCGNYLAATAQHRILCHLSIEDLELAAANLFITEWTFFRSPLETLHQAVFALNEQALVHLARQAIVDQDIGPVHLRAKCPNRSGCQEVPVVVLREEVAHAALVPLDANLALLDVLAEPFLQRLGHHVDLILLVRRLCKALQGTGFHHCLAKLYDGIRHFDLQITIKPSKVVKDAVQVNFASTQQHMLATLFHLGLREWVGLVDLPQAIHHLRQLRRLQWLDGDLDDRSRRKAQWSEDLDLFLVRGSGDGRRLLDARLNASYKYPISCWDVANFHTIPALEDPEILDLLDCHVLVVIQRVRLSQDLHTIATEDCAGKDTAKDIKGIAIGSVVLLHHMKHQISCGIQLLHVF